MPTTQTGQAQTEIHAAKFLTCPRRAALLFGRRLNELEHRLEIAWLMPDGRAMTRVRQLWRELRLISRDPP